MTYGKHYFHLLLSLFLVGCTLSSEIQVVATQTLETPAKASLLTSTPTLTLTATPISTLSLEQKKETLMSLYENNGICQLPCYLGIMPGESLWSNASKFLGSIGEVKGPGGTDKVPNYGVVFDVNDIIGEISPIFWVKDDLVVAIGTNSSWVSADFDHSLSGILNSFGKPEEIWIRPIFDVSDNQPFYYLVLMYHSMGIIAELTGIIENQNGDFVICPQNIFSRSPYPPSLFLWSPREQVEFKNFGEDLIDDDLGWVIEEYRLLHDVSVYNLTNQEFYEIYSKPNTDFCMAVKPVR